MSRFNSSAWRRCSVIVFVWLSALSVFAQSGDFTIVALPDTQHYSSTYPQIFTAQTQWIADNIAAKNIKLVLGEGDIVNGGGELGQWQNADAAMKLLDGKVPYMSALGNHDYDHNDPPARTASTLNFNNYFGPNRYLGSDWYRGSFVGGSNENFYGTFSLGGATFLVMALEVFPRTAVLDWANSVIDANPDKEVILLTHGYEYSDDTRIGRCDEWNKTVLKLDGDNDGNDMWEKVVRKHANISLVLSGHVTALDGTGRRADLGDNGNLVNQVLADYQTLPNGGNGWLRIMTFHPASNTIDVQTYSPWLNAYMTDSENQFTLIWHAQGGIAGQPGTVTGRVRSAIDCRDIAGATVSAAGVSTTTDTRGIYKLTVPAGKSTPVKVTASGWIGQTASLDVPPGFSTQGEFFIATGGQLNGTVVDATGKSIAGATVTLNGGYAPTNLTLTTDTAGAFKSGWISTGAYTISASSSSVTASLSANVLTGQTATASVVLGTSTPPPTSTTGTLTGAVTSAIDGRVLANATVTAGGKSGLSDSSGQFIIADLAAGTYTATASLSGWSTNSVSATVVSSATTSVGIKLATTGRISGTVTTSAGAVVTGAKVTFTGGLVASNTSVSTSTTGTYTSAWIPVGSYTVTVAKSGLPARTGSATVISGGKVLLNFKM